MKHCLLMFSVLAVLSSPMADAQFIIEKTDASTVPVDGNAVFSANGVSGVEYRDIAAIYRGSTTAEESVITFEDCDLTDDAYKSNNYRYNTVDNTVSTYTEQGIVFSNYMKFSYVGGVVVSKFGQVSDWDSKYTSQCSTVAVITEDASQPAGADGSSQFAVFYHHPTIADDPGCVPELVFPEGEEHEILSLQVNNVADIWQKCKIGYYSRPGFSEGDYYEVVFIGQDAAGTETGRVTVNMADFRDGQSIILNEWTDVDLSSLGKINKLTISANYTDTYLYFNYNSASYGVCVDNIRFK